MENHRINQAAIATAGFVAGVTTLLATSAILNLAHLRCSLIHHLRSRIASACYYLGESIRPAECLEEQGQVASPVIDEVFKAENEAVTNIDFKLPRWFLENCVETFEDLSVSRIPLAFEDRVASTSDENVVDYVVDPVAYSELRNLIQEERSAEALMDFSTDIRAVFKCDAAILRVPVREKQSGEGFLHSLLRQFAKDLGAHILVLRQADIYQLCDNLLPGQANSENNPAFDTFFQIKRAETIRDDGGHQETTHDDENFEDDSTQPGVDCENADMRSDNGDHESGAVTSQQFSVTFPFRLLLDAPEEKLSTPDTMVRGEDRKSRPLVVILPAVTSFFPNNEWKEMLVQLRSAVGEMNALSTKTIVIGFDNYDMSSMYTPTGKDLVSDACPGSDPYETPPYESMLSLLGEKPLRPVCVLLPRCTASQQELFERNSGDIYRRYNIEAIKQQIRKRLDRYSEYPLLDHYAPWDVSEGDSSHGDVLRDHCFDLWETAFVAEAVYKDIRIEQIAIVLRRLNTLIKWTASDEAANEFSEDDNKFHEDAQGAIKRIKADKYKYQWENHLLGQLVDPNDMKHGWSDIELEDDTRRSITQMVNLANSDPKSQHGILQNSRINGALLYGPPGTGKTHLARVLAREYGAVMLHVSPAEIESKWYGETEKIIKGLFSLAAMVAPSIIFIDEADSLFRKRRSDDYDWIRSRLNTFLGQTDGILRAARPPFLLLATNHPDDLDEAVLRRVPGRLYVGLPAQAARKNMLGIFLREEVLDMDLQLGDIAARTSGFTGSDLQALCVQAALLSQAEVQEGEKKGEGGEKERVLRLSHFEDALTRCGPTVSGNAIDAIREFARKFDKNAMSKLGRSYSQAEMADRRSKRAPQMRRERGSANQVPSWMKQVEYDESGSISFEEWQNSNMYPYVTEDLYQKWGQDAAKLR